MWDETIYELRNRVKQYDINYFYDVAIENQDKRRKLNVEEDLDKVSDAELIKGAKDMGIIGELGYRHLDHVKYMRNWASAAHPNHNEISGLQLTSMLETCIREVIKLPISHIAIEIKRLLANIRGNTCTKEDINGIAAFLKDVHQTQIDNLSQGLYGMYTQKDIGIQVLQNINLIMPHVWQLMSNDAKRRLGIKLATSVANGDNRVSELGRAFFNLVSGLSYVPEGILVSEINTALQNLYNSHHNLNNFYNEPIFAKQLMNVMGQADNIPKQIERNYVLTIVDSFLTNGNGTAFDAEPEYRSLIGKFSENQATIALLSYEDSTINSKLQFRLRRNKYLEMLEIIKNKFTSELSKDFVDIIVSGGTPIDKLSQDANIRRRADNLLKIIES